MRHLQQQVLMSAFYLTFPRTELTSLLSRGCSALSPTGKILAAMNFVDGVDWFDTEKQAYLGTTRYDLGECIPISIKFLSDGTVVVGHSRGRLVVAAFYGVVKKPMTIAFDHPSNPSE